MPEKNHDWFSDWLRGQKRANKPDDEKGLPTPEPHVEKPKGKRRMSFHHTPRNEKPGPVADQVQRQTVAEMVNLGVNYKLIAETLGKKEGTIKALVSKMKKEGWNINPKRGRPSNVEKLERYVELYRNLDAGKITHEEIAQIMGITVGGSKAVKHYLIAKGLL